jgi:hypothetical protein
MGTFKSGELLRSASISGSMKIIIEMLSGFGISKESINLHPKIIIYWSKIVL